MPYSVVKRGDKCRLYKKSTGKLAVNSNGTAIDGGGHKSQTEAENQIGAIAASEHKSLANYK